MSRRARVPYNNVFKFTHKHELKAFRDWFKTMTGWQLKQTRDGYEWYDHNPNRSNRKRKCKYANGDDSCRAKIKFTSIDDATQNGIPLVMKANPEGEEHLLEEYFADFTQWAENFVGTDPENIDKPSLVLLKQFEETLSEKEVNELEEWDQLIEKMKSATLKDVPKDPPPYEHPPATVISVSNDNHDIDWDTLLDKNNIKMMFARSSVGISEDQKFKSNFEAMQKSKLDQIGAYHHFIGKISSPTPNEQFDFLKKLLEDVKFDKKKHLLAFTVQTELNAKFTPLDYTAKLLIFIGLFLKDGFMRPIIYCNNNSWDVLIDKTINDRLLSTLPLWIAHFTQDDKPRYPSTWSDRKIPWWMWNYSGTGTMEGITNHCNFHQRNEAHAIDNDLFKSAV